MPNRRGECSWCGTPIADPPERPLRSPGQFGTSDSSPSVEEPKPEVAPAPQPVAAPTEEAAVAKQWTRELIIDAIKRWAAKNGRPPKAEEWQRGASDERPGYATVVKYCGSWPDAIRASGFEVARGGARPGAGRKPASSSVREPKVREAAQPSGPPPAPVEAAPPPAGAVVSEPPSPVAAEAGSRTDETLDAWLATLELTPPRLQAEEERLRAVIAELEERAAFVNQLAGSLDNLRGAA